MFNQPLPRVNTENSPLSIFRERKPNPGLCLHRRSMSDTISEFGHLSQGQKPIHAVTDSELAKPETHACNSAAFRKDEGSSWYSSIQRQSIEMKDTGFKPQYHNLRMIKRYDEVAHYETHFLSPYDDCPLSTVKDTVSFPHFSLGYRPKQDYSPVRPDMIPPDSTTPKIFVQETRYDVRQAYQRRSNETIASSVQSSREDLSRRCKHNHSGTSVWQCDCNETENVWIRKLREKKRLEGQNADSQKPECQKFCRSDNQKANKLEGQKLEGFMLTNWPGAQKTSRGDIPWQASETAQQNAIPQSACFQNMQFNSHMQTGSKGNIRCDGDYRPSVEDFHEGDTGSMAFYGDDSVFLDQGHRFQEQIMSSSQGHYGLTMPVRDPLGPSGNELNALEMKSRDQCMSESCMAGAAEKSAAEARPGESDGKKPLRSSLKSPSDGIKQKFRKKHITQKVVAAGDKKKLKGKDNVMVTSL